MWWLPRAGVPRPPGLASPDRSPDRAVPSIFIQCAADTRKRDQDLAGFQKDLDSDLARLEGQSQASLAALKTHLLWICLATFAATTVGGCWLIGVGLSPLRRLSDAVSRVSAKDFRLPLDGPAMPAELRPIVERLTQTLELLRRAFAREKQAAADISHELRTPLAALLTTIEVALRKPRTSERYEELLQECQAIGLQMNQLVERLLALARLDAGADQVRPQEVNVAELARQSLAMVRPLARTRGLDLRISCPESVHLSTDPDKLREILTNLLHNAIEYNRPGGQVDLSVERHDGHLRFDVRDTGVGIPSEAQAQIFERFYRADPSRQANGLHAGLGLAIVRGYVQLLGGTVNLESKEGQGSVFRVELPVEHASSS
jgi:heavy metal sensor kinase